MSATTDLVSETTRPSPTAGAYFPRQYYWYYSLLRLQGYTKLPFEKRPQDHFL